jgi:hypothetical protein
MTQEDKELLLKDLCARLVYTLKVQYKGKTYNLLGIDRGRIFVNLARVGEWLPTVYTFDIKPYLRPMSSMTEEEESTYEQLIKDIHYKSRPSRAVALTDWLNAHYLDYRGLIPKGLALVAPDGMYKMEEQQ